MTFQNAKNYSLIPIFFIFILSLTGCDFNTGTTPESHIDNAKKLLSENKLNEAILELKNALQKESNLPEARWLLGTIYLRFKNGSAAFSEFSNAQSLGYSHPELEGNLLRAMLLQGKYQKVLGKIAPRSDDTVETLIIRAEALIGLKKNSDARSNYNKALELDSDSI